MKAWSRLRGGQRRAIPPPKRSKAMLSVVLGFALLAFLLGALASLFGGVPALFLTLVIVPFVITLRDYRIGVLMLTILLPWADAPMLPRGNGISVGNVIALVTILSFGIHFIMRRRQMIRLPRVVLWCYVVPLGIGVLIALPHLRQAGISMGDEVIGKFDPVRYFKGHYLDELIYPLYAFLLANAVRESKRPERWLIVFAAATFLPVIAMVLIVAVYRVPLSELQAMRGFTAPLGYHTNGMAWLLASVLGPLLYVTFAVRGWARAALFVITVGVGVALILTFSRAGFLALMVVLAMFAISRRRLTVFLLVAIGVVIVVLAVPAVQERLSTGIQGGAIAQTTSRSALAGDALSAGRLEFWPLLAREVVRSPIWGRGVGSTAWSQAAREGLFTPTHPHNLYLNIAMDLGLVGLGLILYLYYRIGRTYYHLAHERILSAPIRAFFAGALASMAACGVMGMTGGQYEALQQSSFLWFSLGLAVAWWQLGQGEPAAARAPWAFGIRPMAKRYPISSRAT